MDTQIKCPLRAVNGRVIVRQLPYKPSKYIEMFSIDKADESEAIVESVSPFRHGYRTLGAKRGASRGTEVMTDQVFPHDVKVGDRVFFKPKYSDDDICVMNGEKYRSLDPREILAIIEPDRPEGYVNLLTGEVTPDSIEQVISGRFTSHTADQSSDKKLITP